jgi:hypothetical protein
VPATLPTKTEPSLGVVLTDARAPRPNELAAVHLERIKDRIIELATELGLLDGTTPNSIHKDALFDADFAGTFTGHLVRTGTGLYAAVKNNLTAITSPTIADLAGYSAGSIWINGNLAPVPRAFVFAGEDSGDAIWVEIAHLATTTPANVVSSAPTVGTSTTVARSDHTHLLTEAVLRTVTATLTAATSVNSQRLTSVADPTGAQDAATKFYVDSVASGLDPKQNCRLASTANIASLSTLLTIDGVTTVAGDRVLVKNQTAGETNGIYIAAAGAWTRSTDADSDAEVTSGLYTWVSEGTVNADSAWVLTTSDPITLGVTVLSFTQFSGLGQITAGAGLTKTANTLDVVANADASIFVNANDIQVGILATDAQHGNRGGSALHALAIADGANGFLSGVDKAKLDRFQIAIVTTTDATVTTILSITLAATECLLIVADTVAQRTDTTADVAGYTRRAVVRREAAGAASLVSTVDTIGLDKESAGSVTWDATIDVSGNDVRVRVMGQAAKTVNWRTLVQTVRIV